MKPAPTPFSLIAAARSSQSQHTRRHPRDEEHRLQCACVRWFALAHPTLRPLLFAVPNGGRRDAATGARLKAEGVVPGVADLLLLVPAGRHHGLCIEMKTPAGRQSPAQREWQRAAEAQGYRYALVRTPDQFRQLITQYLTQCPNTSPSPPTSSCAAGQTTPQQWPSTSD